MSTFGKAKVRTRKALGAAQALWAIGGCDISMNERGKRRGRWQPHTGVITPDNIRSRANKRAFAACLRKTPSVPRPTRMLAFNGLPGGIAYLLKTEFVRRETLPKVVDETGSTTRRRNTRDRPLRARQKVELMVALDRAGLMSRLFLHGVEIQPGPKWPVFALDPLPRK